MPQTQKNSFQILYFATAASYTRTVSDTFPAPLALGGLFAALEDRYPGMRKAVLGSCAVTVNLEYVDVMEEGVVIGEGDEVAIIPPVSSG